ncbi:membrane protein [Streptococcus troglodytae]|uniref:Membrane protein n=2 Tax=Streptococcus troglodytae TaxID=1111760 RepID=A0A1L7LKH1_9STRE|nr:membrane protein [Streptococcus troglodytae]
MIAAVFQSYILKVYNRIRDIKMPLVPTLKELKHNVMQMDEAELETNYKMSFDIVMNLSGAILPAIYLILFFWSFITQEVELTGILVATSIHLYIMIKSFKMTREYYK